MAVLFKNIDYKREAAQFIQKYTHFTEAELNLILPLLEIRTFDKKTLILQPGEVEQYFNLIVKGLVRKYVIIGKKEIILQLSTEQHIIYSELSFHRQQPCIDYVGTIEPTQMISISYNNLQHLFETHPKMVHLARLFAEEMFIRKDQRAFLNLNNTTRERFLSFVNNNPEMLQRVPQKYLASYLNIKPETFSRLKHLVAKQ